jgi:hypothetical protein
MVEVTVWTVVACQSKGGSDAARQTSGAGLALACCTGEPIGQAQPEDREGGAGPRDQGRARGSSAWRPTKGRRKGEEKEGKRKRRKEIEKKKRKKGK